METSSSTTKRKKIVSKESAVLPSNYHLPKERQYAVCVVINGQSTYSAWFNTKKEAEKVKPLLEIALDYASYSTMEEESTGREGVRAMAERVRIMNERYKESGREDDPDHPMHGLFTGLATKNEQIPNNNSE